MCAPTCQQHVRVGYKGIAETCIEKKALSLALTDQVDPGGGGVAAKEYYPPLPLYANSVSFEMDEVKARFGEYRKWLCLDLSLAWAPARCGWMLSLRLVWRPPIIVSSNSATFSSLLTTQVYYLKYLIGECSDWNKGDAISVTVSSSNWRPQASDQSFLTPSVH